MPSAAPALAIAAAVLLAAAPTAAAGDGWSVAPSAADPQGRPYFYAEGLPGAVLEDTVSVRNPGRAPLTVRLRGAGPEGGSGPPGGAEAAGAGAWITFAERTVRVPARTRADVPFTVSVPADATPGDHSGSITADAAGRSTALRVHVRVGGPALAALTVERVRVRAGRISYDLVNRGTTALTPRLAVHADGLFGEVLDRAPRTLPVELLPGRRVTLGEPWADQPALDSVDVRLTVTAAGGARAQAGASARFVPWTAAGAAGALAVCAGGGSLLVRRRRRPRDAAAAEQPRTEVESTGAVT
ncbi:COG1470 family protein [Streptomyces fructofermentans]|uniref:DUF916 domain-containing protein n=1 Tax=Streptomyces fructofermentans TaxID=152141 RepID=A0A918K0I7_9ACTN|nr:hypothetical protein [Streptomyces fructofermentans]GGX38110.1 hypothetical protein GCM10010515_00290 [Streptomyces fructofermentans]